MNPPDKPATLPLLKWHFAVIPDCGGFRVVRYCNDKERPAENHDWFPTKRQAESLAAFLRSESRAPAEDKQQELPL